MLSKLSIKNVALIDNAEIIFSEGLNVLSGETGAGKSVILDSVNFVLGAKADRSMIRHGETECMVKAEFVLPETAKAVQTLAEMDIDSDGEVIISRKFNENGKNSIKINGNAVTATMLRKVTDSLVDVHGQSEHFFLLQESNQLKVLDEVSGEALQAQKTLLNARLKALRDIAEKMSVLGGDEKERGRRLDILQFQIDEITAVDLQDGEEENLLAKRNKIVNMEKIISALQDGINALLGEVGAIDGLRMANRALSTLNKLDESYSAICEKLEGLTLEIDDVASTLNDMANEMDFDEGEAEEIESRLDVIRSLKRKYGANKKEIDEYLQSIQEEYEILSNCEEQFARLTKEKEKLQAEIYSICLEMTAIRKKAGTEFCARVTNELKTLNIPNAKFTIDFDVYTKDDVTKANANGLDGVRFSFSANAGEPLKPLGKIISGGEMSRFMLAVKTQLSSVNEICTYIFDEIDAGISGKTAKVVGEKLAKIAKNTQIIAVSHLAQIVSLGDAQYYIEKTEENGKTLTRVRLLDEQGKITEIVRLLGGEQGEVYAEQHAKKLLKQAHDYKQTLL